jgi:rhodanese-related sulfurtransferase
MADPSRVHRWLAVTAGLLGAFALGAGEPRPARIGQTTAHDERMVTALDVARWIRDGRSRVRLIDARADSLFEAYHIPGAEHVGVAELSGRAWDPDETVVLYADHDTEALRAAAIVARQGAKRVQVLRGGLLAWIDQIVEPRLMPLDPTASAGERVARREHLELSRYFGGTPLVLPAARHPGADSARPTDARTATEATAVARIIRRGC